MAMTERPKIDDIDPQTGAEKYKTFDEYAEASEAWTRASAIQDFKGMVAAGCCPRNRLGTTYPRGRA